MNNKKIFLSGFWIIVGVALIALDSFTQGDSFWAGMGGGLLAVGILGFTRQIKYRFNESYRNAVNIKQTDERNRFISNKAWAYAGYIFVLISAVMSLMLRFLGYKTLSLAASTAICLIITIYWITYLILSKKY